MLLQISRGGTGITPRAQVKNTRLILKRINLKKEWLRMAAQFGSDDNTM